MQHGKGGSSPTSIPLSPNYFDVLSEEEDAPQEETTLQETKISEMQRVIALSMDPKEKAPVPLWEHEAETTEEALQLALHRSREEAQKRSQRGKEKGLQIGREKEAPRARQ